VVSTLPLADRWFEYRPVGDGVTRVDEPHVDPWLRSNIWVVHGSDRDLVVDCGNGIGPLRPDIENLVGSPSKPLVAAVTHSHTDHVGGFHEFDERVCHRLEAPDVAESDEAAGLVAEQYDDAFRTAMADEGWPLPDVLVTAGPHEGFDPVAFEIHRAQPTRLVDDGEVVDIGDRSLHILHLPGHTAGSIALFEERSGLLFSGDTLFHATVAPIEQADLDAYIASLQRLRELSVRVVHGGHGPSFGGSAVAARIDENIARCQAWTE
jgi:glyoxylase-like metal-dependent hydrolase (beta-lactamase superfamily II)